MSADDVEIVRRIHEAWSRGEAVEDLGLIDDEIEYVNPPDALEPGLRRGFEGFRLALQALDESFVQYRVEVEELVDAGDRVVAVVHTSGQGRSSGVEFERRQGFVWTLRNGRAVRFQWFNTPAQARAEAGLE